MKLSAFIIFSIIIFTTAAHADDGWVTLASSEDGMIWQAKPGSIEFSKTTGGTEIVIVTGRVTRASTPLAISRKWYVSVYDCIQNQGALVTLSLSGAYQHRNDFVFGGDNVASRIAGIICRAAEKDAAEQE